MEKKLEYLRENKKKYTPLLAMEEASRCLLCYDAPCSKACPSNTNPAKFIRSLRFRNLDGAIETIRENNILAGVCARVCPHDKYCENACIKSGIDKPINISTLQMYLIDYEKKIGIKVLKKRNCNKEKVAIIGSGPSGLAAGTFLAQRGYKVTIFDKREKPGGWLTYGIPPYKLPQEVVDYEIDYIRKLGVKFKLNCKINKNKRFKSLKDDGFKAILVACGLDKSKSITLPGKNMLGVINGTDFLSYAKLSKGNIAIGNKVVIIGGGNVAIDSAATAKLLGAKDVKIVYRRSIEKMPANYSGKEFMAKLNIPIFTGLRPSKIEEKNGAVSKVQFEGMFDTSKLQLEADVLIFAIGQQISELEEIGYIDKNENGIIVGENHETNLKGIFACGDIIDEDKTVVSCVKSGKKAAEGIDIYLSKKRENKKSLEEVSSVKEEG